MATDADAETLRWQRLFGYRVRELRDERGIAQSALAETAEIHATYLSGIESGRRNPSLATILRLARALEVGPADLLPQP